MEFIANKIYKRNKKDKTKALENVEEINSDKSSYIENEIETPYHLRTSLSNKPFFSLQSQAHYTMENYFTDNILHNENIVVKGENNQHDMIEDLCLKIKHGDNYFENLTKSSKLKQYKEIIKKAIESHQNFEKNMTKIIFVLNISNTNANQTKVKFSKEVYHKIHLNRIAMSLNHHDQFFDVLNNKLLENQLSSVIYRIRYLQITSGVFLDIFHDFLYNFELYNSVADKYCSKIKIDDKKTENDQKKHISILQQEIATIKKDFGFNEDIELLNILKFESSFSVKKLLKQSYKFISKCTNAENIHIPYKNNIYFSENDFYQLLDTINKTENIFDNKEEKISKDNLKLIGQIIQYTICNFSRLNCINLKEKQKYLFQIIQIIMISLLTDREIKIIEVKKIFNKKNCDEIFKNLLFFRKNLDEQLNMQKFSTDFIDIQLCRVN